MKLALSFIIFSIGLVGCRTLQVHPDQISFSNVELIQCYDGDTCRFNISGVHSLIGKDIRVRINDVEAPEIKRAKCEAEKEAALQSRDFLQNELMNASRIDLINVERGKFFRLIAHIIYDGKNAAQELLKAGHVKPYNGSHKPDWCTNLKNPTVLNPRKTPVQRQKK